MRTPRSLLLLAASGMLVAAAIVAPLSAAGSAVALTNCNAPADANAAAEAQMLVLMNQARAQAGLGSLSVSASLTRAALWKSADSSAYGSGFSHTDSLGRTTVSNPDNRAIDCGYSTWAAEDLAWGYPDANSTFNAWMNSPGHRANILDPNAIVVGIGLVYQNGVPCWTADFGAVADTSSSQQTTTSPATSQSTSSPRISTQQLYAGVNLVVFTGQTESVKDATASIAGSLNAVYSWNAATQSWDAYFPGAPDYAQDLLTLNSGSAYYIMMRTGATWTY